MARRPVPDREALRIRIHRGFWGSRFGLAVLVSAVVALLAGTSVFTFYYIRYARMIERRLADGQIYQNTSSIYTAPRKVFTGQSLARDELVAYLQRAGYAESVIPGARGRYALDGQAVEIWPSQDSYFRGRNWVRIEFSGGRISRIRALDHTAVLDSAELEPELLTNLFDSSRTKRRLVRFADLPKVLVEAVLAAEDKRFFEHPGFDPVRVLGAAWVDLRRGEKAQGASTITMQVARSFFFSTERTWQRKLAETMVALQLEQRFSKEQIFELYANQVYLGNRGSFAIHGFGEAAQAYFGKDVRELNLAEAAFLAGIIRAPNRYSSADRRPERAAEARDRVLDLMVENKMISSDAAALARKSPLRLVNTALESGSAPYFVDMVKDYLLERYTESQLSSRSYRIYTTLDPGLQRAAAEAVEAGLKNLDTLLARRYQSWRRRGEPAPLAQVALVALDPATGEIKALIGGRHYGQSQLNRVLARRPPGSVFKPFVYAAALSNAVDGYEPVLHTTTTVVDEPTTFYFGGEEYSPNNYGQSYYGTVTLREALVRSLNVATVKVAELVGYSRVVEVVRQMGLGTRIQPTPAMALGAYEMTPLEVAAAYTPFANGGRRAEPKFLRAVIASDGTVVEQADPKRDTARQVLDPRVAYIVNHMLQDVINRGTGAVVRARGFTAPAAGKTGTSHDGWFAGFTSNLLCVVWVGFDDYRELGLSGAASAAPIWTEFMKRAIALPGYQDPQPFSPPAGVTLALIDPLTLQLAPEGAPGAQQEVFITGAEPPEVFYAAGGASQTSWLSRLFGGQKSEPAESGTADQVPPPAATSNGAAVPARPAAKARRPELTPGATAPAPSSQPQKKGFWQKIFGIFGGGKAEKDKAPEEPKQSERPKPPARQGGPR